MTLHWPNSITRCLRISAQATNFYTVDKHYMTITIDDANDEDDSSSNIEVVKMDEAFHLTL